MLQKHARSTAFSKRQTHKIVGIKSTPPTPNKYRNRSPSLRLRSRNKGFWSNQRLNRFVDVRP